MDRRRSHKIPLLLTLGALFLSAAAGAEGLRIKPVNKLLYMYRFYYLPFSMDFEVGRDDSLILPFFPERYPEPAKLFSAEELNSVDSEWNELKKNWGSRSLLETTKVPDNESVRISQRLISHRIPLTRTAFDKLPINDRIQLKDALQKKAPRVRSEFLQLIFLKSFMTALEEEKFNFFIVGASWCNSSREYRVLFETYVKKFANPGLNLHSVVVDDPKGKIFETQLLKDLFPHKDKYSHDSIPRFLAYQLINGVPKVWEEGEALKELYDRFFKSQRGFLDEKTTVFRNWRPKRSLAVDPALSSVAK